MLTHQQGEHIIALLEQIAANTAPSRIVTRRVRGASYTMDDIHEALAEHRSVFDDLTTPAEH